MNRTALLALSLLLVAGGRASHDLSSRARANVARMVSIADYPASARRAGEQGTAEFTLVVGPDGRVSDCTITASSASAALDAVTCRIMTARAQFTPARDRE